VFVAALPLDVRAADNQTRDAGKHFQRGVDLYGDGDFRGALVEFKKAYSIWPRANVLYDIGQTEYQLLDYAAALKTMERYLAETGASAPHRQEVESTVEVLRGRVGRVALTTEPSCDVTVDDQPCGMTPLDGPLAISVGLHTIAVSCAGRSAKKRIEVAGGETQKVELHPPPAPAILRPAVAAARDADAHKTTRPFVTGWIISGVLVGATIGFGIATLVEESRLNALRGTYPVQKNDLDRQQALTTGLAITSDILGAASVVAVGVSTYLTVKNERDKRLRVGIGTRGVQVTGSF
jgi:hypothetical protein